jgi:hypothetical protein
MLNRLLIAAVFALAACSSPASKDVPEKAPENAAPAPDPQAAKWTVTEGIETPESVYVDSDAGFIFVSNVVGMPGEKDGNGRISKLSLDGKVVEAAWVTGLNAPKGMRSYKGVLWTSDIDEVVSIEIASGKITNRVKIANAKFLNDVACGPDGVVYVSDMMATKIYAIKDGKPAVFAEGDDLEYPNGLIVEGDRLIVGGWGKPEADFTTKTPGRLFSLDLKTKKKTPITPNPAANIDGLESDGKGGYVASDWLAGKIFHVAANGEVSPVRTFKQGTADIAYIASSHLLIVPHMQENRIAAYDISDVAK